MGKQFIIKRDKKNISVDTYIQNRESQKTRQKEIKSKVVLMDNQVENRYRFKKHNQKLNEIDIHIANRIQEIKLIPDQYDEEQLGSFFYDELENQRSSNFTHEYTEFYIKIIDQSQNLPLILNNLEMIVDTLLQYLPSFQKEMLDLIKNLIRDCRGEVYLMFCDKIFLKIVELIQIQNLELVEHVFQTLAQLLRYFFKDIQKDFYNFYKIFQQFLLQHRNKHIRRFACEALSWVLRKTNNVKEMIIIIFESVKEINIQHNQYQFYFTKQSNFTKNYKENFIETISYLLKENIKSLDKQLSQKYDILVNDIFNIVINQYSNNDNVKQIVKVFIYFTVQEIKQKNNQYSSKGIEQFLNYIYDHSLMKSQNFVNEFLEISCFLVQYKFGKLINAQILNKILSFENLSIQLMAFILKNLQILLENEIQLKYETHFFKIQSNQLNQFLKSFIYLPQLDNKEEYIDKKYQLNKIQYDFILYQILESLKQIDFQKVLQTEQLENLYIFYILHKKLLNDKKIQLKQKLIIEKNNSLDFLIKLKFISITNQQMDQKLFQFYEIRQIQNKLETDIENIYKDIDIKKFENINFKNEDDIKKAINAEIIKLTNQYVYKDFQNIVFLKSIKQINIDDQHFLIENLSSPVQCIRSYSLKLLNKDNLINLLIEIDDQNPNIESERHIILIIQKIQIQIELKAYSQELIQYYQIIWKSYIRLQTIWVQISQLIRSLLQNYQQLFQLFQHNLIQLNYQTSVFYQQIQNMEIEDDSFLNQILQDDYYEDFDYIDPLFVIETYISAVPYNTTQIESFLKQFFDKELIIYEKDSTLLSEDLKEQILFVLKQEEQINNQQEKLTYKKHFYYLKLIQNLKIQDKQYFRQKMELYIRKNNEQIQQLSLEIYLKLTDQNILQTNQKMLKNLQNKKTQRQEMTLFTQQSIQQSDRPVLIPIMIQILYPKLFNKKGSKNKQSLETNQAVVFGFFQNLQKSEITYLLQLLLQNYKQIV